MAMAEDIALDVNDPWAAEVLRDLADLKRMSAQEHRAIIAKHALENLAVLEARGKCGPHTIAQLRATVLRELLS
jgi:hypothetical protein